MKSSGTNRAETDEEFTSKFGRVQRELVKQDPPIVVGESWIIYNEAGEELRRLKIIGKHPWKPGIIYEEMPAKMRTGREGEIRLIPEFNLRYMCRPEGGCRD